MAFKFDKTILDNPFHFSKLVNDGLKYISNSSIYSFRVDQS